MNTDASTVEDINIHPNQRTFVDVLDCIFWRMVHQSFATDHSPCARMTVTWAKSSILWRCQSPYHRHRWQTCFVLCRTSAVKWDLDLYVRWERKFSECSFHMKTDACNVEDIYIHHIKECLLLSCIAFFWGLVQHLSHSIIHPLQE